MFIYKLTCGMLIFISFRIHFSTVSQFCQYFEYSVGSYKNVLLKYRKLTNIACCSCVIGCVYLDKNVSDLCSL